MTHKTAQRSPTNDQEVLEWMQEVEKLHSLHENLQEAKLAKALGLPYTQYLPHNEENEL